METTGNESLPVDDPTKRRAFLKKGIVIGTLAGVSGIGLVSACKRQAEVEEEEEISPSEDLMREHGVLNRILLIYDFCRISLINKSQLNLTALNNSAQIIRTFIEDYHEKLEENYLFPRFEKANQLTDLVKVLRSQHQAGRILTDEITQLSKMSSLNNETESQKLIKLLADFNTMYRPHEAREDTELFPVIKKIVSKNEYDSLGEEFEDKEHELFGEDGFASMVTKVSDIEKQLGIYDLSKFTPQL